MMAAAYIKNTLHYFHQEPFRYSSHQLRSCQLVHPFFTVVSVKATVPTGGPEISKQQCTICTQCYRSQSLKHISVWLQNNKTDQTQKTWCHHVVIFPAAPVESERETCFSDLAVILRFKERGIFVEYPPVLQVKTLLWCTERWHQ